MRIDAASGGVVCKFSAAWSYCSIEKLLHVQYFLIWIIGCGNQLNRPVIISCAVDDYVTGVCERLGICWICLVRVRVSIWIGYYAIDADMRTPKLGD